MVEAAGIDVRLLYVFLHYSSQGKSILHSNSNDSRMCCKRNNEMVISYKYEIGDKRRSLSAFFHYIGKKTMNVINNLGAVAIFFTLAFLKIFRRKQLREIIQQVFYIGAKSSNIVALVGLFTGMVLGLQLFYTLNKFGSQGVLGSVVALTLIRELGPSLLQ